MNTVHQTIITALLLVVLDTIWIQGYFIGPFASMISRVQKEPMRVSISGVVVAYLSLLVLAVVFIPKTENYYEAFLLGFCVYAVYDATNYATLNNWDFTTAAIDSLWGGALFVLLKYFKSQYL